MRLSDEDFVREYEKSGGGATHIARLTGQNVREIRRRRASLEGRYKRSIESGSNPRLSSPAEHPQRAHVDVTDGVILVGSDGHYWPGPASVAHRAFVHFIEKLKPLAVIMNGDAFDGATISRHPPIGWEDRPTVAQELEAAQGRLGEIEQAAGRARKCWPLGNHDARFETKIAAHVPQLAGVNGVHLQDHFPLWEPCWSVWINDDVVVKHRFKGGLHAPHNNTVTAGKTLVTGHLHSAKVTPWTDYNGTRWGVDTGCLADPWHRAFTDYTEDGPKNWRSGFCVLTFVDGHLLQPELVLAWDENRVQFRGRLIDV